ncbi:MAG: hypothetical protein GH144_04830 [Clostridia bacterium]|nr:hypothetical protein [Clostridia bacterium]
MGNTPKNKYSEVQRTVKEGLMIILVEADYILEEQELTELSHLKSEFSSPAQKKDAHRGSYRDFLKTRQPI